MKIKCYRFECAQCGDTASIQVFYRKDGTIGYTRARHKNTQGFYYHQLTREYVEQKLRELSTLDQGQSSNDKIIDPKNIQLNPKQGIMAGGEGFEPSTPNLGGWCSLRPRR